MDLATQLSAAQVIIGLIALVVGGGAITIIRRKKSKSQSQKIGNNSFGIQSGRDTNIKK